MNHRAKYMGQRLFSWKFIVETHTPGSLLHLDH